MDCPENPLHNHGSHRTDAPLHPEAVRRIGVTESAPHMAATKGRSEREQDGQWGVMKTRRRIVETAGPVRPPDAGGVAGGAMSADTAP